MKKTIWSIITGFIAGCVNGLFGTGGGIVLIPLLMNRLKFDEKKSFAMSVCIMFSVCITSLIIYISVNNYNPLNAVTFSIGGFIGGIAASKLFKNTSAEFISKLFGVLLIIGGIRTVFFP